MSEVRVEVRAGGRIGRAETAAVLAAAEQLMLEMDALGGAGDPPPAADRSAWRQAGLHEAMVAPGEADHDAFGLRS